MTTLRSLILASNKIEGTVPTQIGSMVNIGMGSGLDCVTSGYDCLHDATGRLDIAYNRIGGTIPTEMKQLNKLSSDFQVGTT